MKRNGFVAVQELLKAMKVSSQYPKGEARRAIFCSRTLNLRSIQAIGDYLTLCFAATCLSSSGSLYAVACILMCMLQLLIAIISVAVTVDTLSFVKPMRYAEASAAWHPDQLIYKHTLFR